MNIYTPVIHFADGSETGLYEDQTADFELALAVCDEQYKSAVERNRTNTGHGSDVVKVTVRIDTLTESEFIRWQREQEILNMEITAWDTRITAFDARIDAINAQYPELTFDQRVQAEENCLDINDDDEWLEMYAASLEGIQMEVDKEKRYAKDHTSK